MALLNWLRRTNPRNGRVVCEDGLTHNIGDSDRGGQMEIARGNKPGARPFMAFGERVAIEGETRQPVLPVGDDVNIAPPSAGVTIESNSADDAAGGLGVQEVRLVYLRQDLSEQSKTIPLDGTNPVSIADSEFRFAQCTHVNAWGANGPVAAGDITVSDSSGNVYSVIQAGEVRCTSSYRMIPAGKVLYVDSAVSSSVSGTSATSSQFQVAASEIFGIQYVDPLAFFPFLAIGVQDNGVPLNFPPRGPFQAGTVVGALYSSDKEATVTASWYGRLEDA